MAETLNPINRLDMLIASNELKLSMSKNISAPSIVGMLNKKANLDASFRIEGRSGEPGEQRPGSYHRKRYI